MDVRPLREKIWEMRIKGAGKRHHRILYAVAPGSLLALHGFTKKTNRTPNSEIKLAFKRLKEIVD